MINISIKLHTPFSVVDSDTLECQARKTEKYKFWYAVLIKTLRRVVLCKSWRSRFVTLKES